MDIDKNQLSELVLKLQAGDGKAFEQIYNLTNKSAYFTALKITKNEDDAQDVLQEAYIKLLDTINKLDKPESFMSWFNMVVANKARDYVRKYNPNLFTDNVINGGKDGEEEYSVFDTIEDSNEEFIPGADIEKDQLRRDVMALVDGLSAEKRTAVLLYYYNNMTTKQIAASLRVNENTVKSRLVQAKKDLAKGVKELEKKNGKLLGIAPIPVVIWALKASSTTAGATYVASGAAASLFAAITSPKPVAGIPVGTTVIPGGTSAGSASTVSGTAASSSVGKAVTAGGVATSTSSIATVGSTVAGLTLAQKLAIIFAIISLIIGGSVTAKIVTDKKDAKETTAVSEEYVSEDVGFADNIDSDETTTEVPDEVEPDFERLEEVFPYYSFDVNSKTASDEALYNLIWEFGSARKYLNDNDVKSVFESTTIHGVSFAIGYIRYPADKVDNLMRSLYNVEPNHKEKNTINGYTYCVYDGNYYYLNIEIMGWYDFPSVKSWESNSDGTYTISVEVAEEGCTGEMYTIKAKPIMIDGKSDWSIYSVKRNGSDSTIDYLSTEAIITNTWQNAYKDYLKSKLSEGNDNAYFSLAYIDDDDIPELVYSYNSTPHSTAKVFTFSNGKLVDMGEYGSGGEAKYYERTGIVVTYQCGGNTLLDQRCKKTGDKFVVVDTVNGNLKYDEETDTDWYDYTINGKSATEEEYNALEESYNSKYGNPVNAGRDYQLTYNNIEAYCK